MATQAQYSFFQWLYLEEGERESQLRDRAKNILSLATLYSAFVIFVIKDTPPASTVSKSIFIATVLCMAASFFLSLWGTRIASFEAVNDPSDIIEEFGDEPLSDEEFYDSRIADFTVATERNSKVNDQMAFWLSFSGYFLLSGMLFHALYFLVNIE